MITQHPRMSILFYKFIFKETRFFLYKVLSDDHKIQKCMYLILVGKDCCRMIIDRIVADESMYKGLA